jgi:ribonuclease P protein component
VGLPPLEKSPQEYLSTFGKFPKQARVRHRSEFLHIQRHGLRVHTPSFTIVANRGDANNPGGPRLGCAVSKRVGNAVVRSRARRLIREIFRRLLPELSRVDFVVIAKPQAAQCVQSGFMAVVEDLVPALINANRRVQQKARTAEN